VNATIDPLRYNTYFNKTYYYEMRLRERVLFPNASTFLQTKLAAEGQFLLEKQMSNEEQSMIYRAGTRGPTVSKKKDRI
jgi:hypothetical protein